MFYTNIINEIAITNVVSNFGEWVEFVWIQPEGLLEKRIDGAVRTTYPAPSLALANDLAYRLKADL